MLLPLVQMQALFWNRPVALRNQVALTSLRSCPDWYLRLSISTPRQRWQAVAS